jgi:hypothetical protein
MQCSKPQCYSITSSASAINLSGTVRPSALAVVRLITSANLTGAWAGSSLGFAPVRMRATYDAARRNYRAGQFRRTASRRVQ